MLQRGYILLIAGAVLVVTGIILTAVYGIGLAGLVLRAYPKIILL